MPQSSAKSLVIIAYVALAVSTLLVYWQVHNFDFVGYDDDAYVYENPHVPGGITKNGLVWAFTTGYSANWHPLTWLSHMLDCELFGLDPGRMHLVNVVLHIADALLLFAVLKAMTGALWPSAFVAAAFALHPMHVQSVAWIAERKDVLSTLFLFLTLAAYASYVKRGGAVRYLLAVGLFAAGLMAKPMLVTVPFLLLLLDYWPLGRFAAGGAADRGGERRLGASGARVFGRLVAEKLPFLALSLVSSLVTFLVQQSSGSVIAVDALPLKYRIINCLLAYARYAGKAVWPRNMAVFYPFDAHKVPWWHIAACVLVLVAVSILVIRLRRSRGYLLVGWLWFVGMLVPVIGLVQVGRQALADRYTYTPYIGLFIMAAWGLPELIPKWPERRIVLSVCALVAIAAMGTAAWRQIGYWSDSITLFSHAIEATRDNDIAYNNRGTAYSRRGRMRDAMEDFSRAIAIRPDYAEAYNNRGLAYTSLGRSQEAMEDFRRAVSINPDLAEAYYNLGVAYVQAGRQQDAVQAYRRAIEVSPRFAQAYYGMANVLAGQGRAEEACEQYRMALGLRPQWPDCMNNLASVIATHPEMRNSDADEAIRLATRACELSRYRNPVCMGTLAAAYASAGRFSEAIDMANRAVSLADAAGQPQVAEALRRHLSFYKEGRPYVVHPPAGDSNSP
jgi:Flp pilus assembly protein TadD